MRKVNLLDPMQKLYFLFVQDFDMGDSFAKKVKFSFF